MSGLQQLVRYTRIPEIVGDVVRLRAKGVALGDMAEVENTEDEEAFPADLDSAIKSVYERAGVIRTADGSQGSLKLIGMYKNWNYSPLGSADYGKFKHDIEAAADQQVVGAH